MKNAMKSFLSSLGIVFIIFIIGIIFLIYKMPSAWQVKQTLASKSGSQRMDEGKTLSDRALHENFLNEHQPIASVCAYLSDARSSHFLKVDNSASSRQFMIKMIEGPKDPFAEAAAPFFRYFFRLPEVRELVQIIDNAHPEPAEPLRSKAEFYGRIAVAALEIRENKSNFDQILMKTYNLYTLARAVRAKPELARSPAILRFCEQLEKNINMNLPYDPNQQAEEFQRFLTSAGLSAKEVDYDANYRSDVKFAINDKSILLGNIWIEKLFAEDIDKAKKKIDSFLPLPDYSTLER